MREEDKYRGIGEKEVIKKRNGKRSKTTESGGARKNKTRPNEGEPTEKERLRKKKSQKEG